MSEHFDPPSERDSLRLKIMGFGELSLKKSYYPELQQRMLQLEKFRTLMDIISDAIFIFSETENRIVDVNEAACLLLGSASEELISVQPDTGRIDKKLQYITDLVKNMSTDSGTVEIPFGESNDRFIEITLTKAVLGEERFIVLIGRDITERKLSEKKLEASLKEKVSLISEIHHRVKNNMQIISSLMNLQASRLSDPLMQDVFQECRARVRSMAIIHEKLYASENLSRVDIKGYTMSLGSYLKGLYKKKNVIISVQGDSVFLAIDRAVPCGLLLNELISNALKHAFPDERDGEIRINLTVGGVKASITVTDNGIGFPGHLDLQNASTLGLQLVNDLSEQLSASISVESAAGTTFNLSMSVD
jgi:PAS domain S-box-containing protein